MYMALYACIKPYESIRPYTGHIKLYKAIYDLICLEGTSPPRSPVYGPIRLYKECMALSAAKECMARVKQGAEPEGGSLMTP